MHATAVVQTENIDGVSVITLNRPDVLNALNIDLLSSLVEALRDQTRCARSIVVQGAGRAFCAGEDLTETLAPETGSPDELRVAFGQLQDITRLMTAAPCPVVAAVHGYAIGGGAEIALAADFVIAGPAARMKFPESVIGHAPTGGITGRLPMMVGLLRAKDLLLTGRWVEPQEGLAIGLYTEVSDDPKARAVELARTLAANPPRSQSSVKSAIELAAFAAQEANLRMEVDMASYCFASAETAQSFEDFRTRDRNRR
ncbi:enoyl-CoA hydratase/isomerase family protein [Mycolicibacterium goodii]|uniref:enoyl-CoA hydratase/isomerase family protein n=1 Tax=Mycolicibacterium goodii TaxID=134601 RepID=UPI000C26708B|nr:enoyl-CoA hydratase/isomerase family protein [Mycolicibacterium goodii]PJK22591.1 enoyl-CoA hydratase [Mycolicibacterium goodii]ULN49220.1 enoyl-CoA hydratase/isomerase family protein [Mycolicibacterium goodii]